MYGQPPGYSSYTPTSPTGPGSPYGQHAPQAQPPKQQGYSTGYTPASFDAPGYGGGVRPEQFYRQLIDPSTGRPTEVLTRMADSLFFYADAHCDVVGLRGTSHMEPRKYIWLATHLGASADSIQAIELTLQDFYTTAQIPFRLVNVQGQSQPVLDRRGFLHMVTFEARAAPDEAHDSWTKALASFGLVDPATQQPLPMPLPRSAFPTLADSALSSAYMAWQMRAVTAAARARSDAMVSQIYSAAGLGAAGLGAGAGASTYANMFGAGAGGGGTNPYLAMMQASQAQSTALTNQYLQSFQAQQQPQPSTQLIGTAANVITTLMGGGTGFTGFGM